MDKLYTAFVKVVLLVVTHIRPHLDEIAAWWLALRHGRNIFPGLETAKLLLWPAGNRTPDGRTPRQWKEESGAVLFGVGGAQTEENPDGAEFDEHGLERKTCTLVLVLEALGLAHDPRFRELLKFALSNDRKGISTRWDASNILKALNAHAVTTLQVVQMYFEILDAHYNRMAQSDPEWTNHRYAALFDDDLAQWIWDMFGGKAKTTAQRPTTAIGVIEFLRLNGRPDLSGIEGLAKRDHTKGATGPFDIVTMYSELVENGSSPEHRRNFVYVIMEAKHAQQRMFNAAADEVAANVRITWVGDAATIARLQKPRVVQDPDITRQIAELEQSEEAGTSETADETKALIEELRAGLTKSPVIRPGANIITERMDGIKPFKIVSMVTDNEEVLKALRGDHPDAQFYLRRQTSQHTIINMPEHLMDFVAEEVRTNEHMRRSGSLAPPIPKERLRQAGNIPEEPAWSLHREGKQMLNGPLTSPGDPHTLQSLEGLEKGIARAVRQAAIADPRRLCIGGILPRLRPSGKPRPSKVPAPPRVPQASGKGRTGGHQRGHGRHHGRRPNNKTTRPAASSSGGFDNRPFANIPPVATPDPKTE